MSLSDPNLLKPPQFCTFSIAFHIFVTDGVRHFQFGIEVVRSKFQPRGVKPPLKTGEIKFSPNLDIGFQNARLTSAVRLLVTDGGSVSCVEATTWLHNYGWQESSSQHGPAVYVTWPKGTHIKTRPRWHEMNSRCRSLPAAGWLVEWGWGVTTVFATARLSWVNITQMWQISVAAAVAGWVDTQRIMFLCINWRLSALCRGR